MIGISRRNTEMIEYDKRTCHYEDAKNGCTFWDCDECKYFYKEKNMDNYDMDYAKVILEDILETFETLTEEIENLYGRETELTKKARDILEQIKF